MADNHKQASMKMKDQPGPGTVVTHGTPGEDLDREIRAAARDPQGRESREMKEMAQGFPPRARLTGHEVRPGRQGEGAPGHTDA